MIHTSLHFLLNSFYFLLNLWTCLFTKPKTNSFCIFLLQIRLICLIFGGDLSYVFHKYGTFHMHAWIGLFHLLSICIISFTFGCWPIRPQSCGSMSCYFNAFLISFNHLCLCMCYIFTVVGQFRSDFFFLVLLVICFG